MQRPKMKIISEKLHNWYKTPTREIMGDTRLVSQLIRSKITCGFLAVFSLFACPPISNAQNLENYQVQSGDTIAMTVFREPDLTLEARVAADGSIRFPLIGSITVAKKTLPEIQQEIYTLYDNDFLVNPQISLQIINYTQRRVRVRGRVNRPGFVVLPPEEKFTLLDVISAAGDISPSGNEKKVELHRQNKNGETVVKVFDLSKTSNDRDDTNPLVENDDVIVVPESRF